MSDAEMRMRAIYAQELDRDGEEVAALLWRESGPAHPDSANGRIVRAMLAAEAAAIEKLSEALAAIDLRKLITDAEHEAVLRMSLNLRNTIIANTKEAFATAIRSLKEGASHVG
jgi:hypothetical protein